MTTEPTLRQLDQFDPAPPKADPVTISISLLKFDSLGMITILGI